MENSLLQGDNDKMKVGLIIAPPFIIQKKIIKNNGKTQYLYSGIVYEIWENIKKYNNWQNKVEEIPIKLDYDDAISDLYNDKVDILVGNIWVDEERYKKSLITRPLYLSKIVAVYKKGKSHLRSLVEIAVGYFLQPLIILISLGIIFGIGLHKLEPKRGLRKSVKTTIATFFGEAGFLFENASTNIKPVLYICLIMAIAYTLNMILQAKVTSAVVDLSTEELSTKEIRTKNKPFLVASPPRKKPTGNIYGTQGANFKFKDIPIEDMPKFYLENHDKYSGYITDKNQAIKHIKKNPELAMSSGSGFGYKENVFAIRKGLANIKNKIDRAIVGLHYNNIIPDICKKYLGKDGRADMCAL